MGNYKGGLWIAEYPGLIGYVLWSFIVDMFGIYAAGFIHIVFLIISL